MNQQAIDRVKERLSKYLKRTDDSDKSYDNGYCKALEHTLEDLQALGDGWINVMERLPELGDRVLCFENGTQYVAKMTEGGFYKNSIYVEYPTHWMPLPNSPKQ